MRKTFWLAGALAILAFACSKNDVVGPENDAPNTPTLPWAWQNPLPHGNDYVAILALGDDRAISLTSDEVYETSDGGATWRRVNIPIASFLVDLHKRGDVITILDGGFVHVSADNGRAWRRGLAGHGIGRFAAAFWDANHGMVVGSEGVIVTTDDGGDSWTPRLSGAALRLVDVAYLDSLTVFAGVADGAMLRSLNGGKSWATLGDTGAFDLLHEIDVTAGVVRLVDRGGNVITSADGGETWSKVSIFGFDLFAVDFLDAVNGLIAGDDGRIHTTRNGVSWTARAPAITTIMRAVSVSARDDQWVAGDDGEIYRSTNFGSTWDELRTGSVIDLGDVSFANIDVGMTLGSCGLLTTANGGRTWTPSIIPRGPGFCLPGDLGGVWMTSPETAVVVGAGGDVWTTSTRGFSWTERTSGTSFDLSAVAFADANNGIAVGDLGTVLTTDDGGGTWSVRTAATTEHLTAVDFASPEITMIVGKNGTVRRSVDGGVTWARTSTGIPDIELRDIAMVDEKTAVVIGDGTDKFRTTNGGLTWETQEDIRVFNSVAFDSKFRGYTVGDLGEVQISEDGGQTWQFGRRLTRTHLRGVCAINDNTATIVGDNGLIMRTTTGGE